MKVIKTIILSLFLVFICICGYFLISGYNLYKQVIKINEIKSKSDYTKIEDVSPYFKEAIVAVEDHRFYTHNGVDLISTVKAIFTNVKKGAYVTGGSSIHSS